MPDSFFSATNYIREGQASGLKTLLNVLKVQRSLKVTTNDHNYVCSLMGFGYKMNRNIPGVSKGRQLRGREEDQVQHLAG